MGKSACLLIEVRTSVEVDTGHFTMLLLSHHNSWSCLVGTDGHRLKSRSRWSRLVKSVFVPWSIFEPFSRRIRPRASRDVLVKSVGSACRFVMREKELSL